MQLPCALKKSNTVSHLIEKRERENLHYVRSASLAYEDRSAFMSGHLQNGCEAMANSLLVLMPHKQTHGAFSIEKRNAGIALRVLWEGRKESLQHPWHPTRLNGWNSVCSLLHSLCSTSCTNQTLLWE